MGKEKKKHMKDKKHKKHKKEKKRKQSSTESSESSEGEWVEKGASPVQTPKPAPKEVFLRPDDKDGAWGSVFGGVSSTELRRAKEAQNNKERVSMEVKPGQSARELNPYWKDGGTGLPPEKDSMKHSDGSYTKPGGEHGSSGRFQRPDDDRSRKPDDRGSSSRFRKPNEDDRGSSSMFRRPDNDDRVSSNRFRNPDDVDREARRFRRPEDDDSGPSRFKKPIEDDRGFIKKEIDSEDGRDRGRFRKPDDDYHHAASSRQSADRFRESQSRNILRNSGSRGWRKSDPNLEPILQSEPPPLVHTRERSLEKSPSPEIQVLTSDQLNALNAKIFRAELMGDISTAEKLKKQLENSRRASDEDKTVILTQTDGKGFTRPVSRDDRGHGSKKRKVQTHENSKRVRYFADDDDYSLQDMYEKEKYSSSRDQEEDFMNLMGKEMARKDGSLALDDPFEETASVDDRGKKSKKGWDRAVRDQAKKQKVYDECKWCLGAKRNNQSLIVQTKTKVYVTVPTFQSLTQGHCLIVPNSHVSCATQLDEDVWDEIMETRKELVRLFEKHDDQDIIFFENASYLHKHPHMMIHCVPVPREIGDTAPIYFKKALQECESEWTNNKKVVDLAGKGVRKAVPKGLPYFFVDFGDQYGYAHVIEDQQLFPNNFAQEIIGGMMDLDHELWRKQRNVSEEQLSKNLKFLKELISEPNK